MPFKMTAFVYWTGVYNAGLALFLLFPPLYLAVGLNVPEPLWGWLLAGFLGFTSAVLILASRDLRRRAALVYWEALLRYVAALLLVPAGLWRSRLDCRAVGFRRSCDRPGVHDRPIPKELALSHRALLLDRFD